MKQLLKPPVLALAAALSSGATAQAHVSLEQAQVQAGASYKAVLRVTHGCEGTATHTVVVRVPAGFRGAKPMPKPGWTVSVERAPLAQPYESHSRQVTDDVVQVTWQADTRQAWLATSASSSSSRTAASSMPTRPPSTSWTSAATSCWV